MNHKFLLKREGGGFTLVEVLLVVLLVSVLFALLFGGMRSIQQHSESTRCVANLRTLNVGALAYIADHGGFLLPNKNWCQASWDNQPGFRDYVGVTSREKNSTLFYDTPFTCPAIKKRYPESFPSFLNRGYTVNMFAMRYDPQSEAPLFPGKLVNIAEPSRMWMFTEALRGSGSLVTNIKANNSSRELMCFPHSGKQNVVFFDGSVTSMDYAAFWNEETEFRTAFWGNPRPY